ncbi:hypothetical protein B0H16DRAFT_1373556 [Mycena metata]|uniref:MIT domain-containing protein n=1 Tax=Mycena metata TaxID=1033252 RepID=A0AAD7IWL5_9AGAR|nr:hypothetical protein B0H16DRAFT_1373556 [Mycena metata]
MLNTAHEHAANAEDFLSQGLLIPASEEHFKAAEAYEKAMERSNDDSAKRTLKMLYNEHHKAGKELERRITHLKAEGKDPSLPHKSDPPQLSAMRSNSHPYPSFPRSAPSPPPNRPMTDSQGTVDESFMLLGGQRSDPGDAFNQFWNIMQGMLDNLSQPVAFATAPLGAPESQPTNHVARTKLSSQASLRRNGSISSDTDIEEPMVARFARRLGMSADNKKSDRSSNNLKARVPDPDDDFDEDGGDELTESFFLIPSSADSSPAALKKDNASLKLEVDSLKKRLEATERVLQLRKEQDAHLRDSIFQATKEAQRAMGASVVGQPFSVPTSSVMRETPGIKTGREAQYARRVKELEDELRIVRQENDKQNTMIRRYQEKWEKLKESAKRRKETKAAAAADSVKSSSPLVRERIPEEPEPEPDEPLDIPRAI